MKITLKELKEIIKAHTSKLLEAAELQDIAKYAKDLGFDMATVRYNPEAQNLIISLLSHFKSLDDNGQFNETRLTDNYITAIFDKTFGTRHSLIGVFNKMRTMRGEEIEWLENVVKKTIRLRKVKPRK